MTAASASPPLVPAHFHTFLAFDFGLKRTGVAVGNRMLGTASPQATILLPNGMDVFGLRPPR